MAGEKKNRVVRKARKRGTATTPTSSGGENIFHRYKTRTPIQSHHCLHVAKMEGQVNNSSARRPSKRLQTARKSTATLTPEARLTQKLIWAHEEIRRLQRMLFRYQKHNYILMNRLDWCERELVGIPQERDSPESPEPSGHTPTTSATTSTPTKATNF